MAASPLRRLTLAHLPTPLWHHPALDDQVGTEVWVKRDDMTGGAEAGNKIRKLEFLLACATEEQATVVLTCGAAQSNHARATVLLAAGLGLRSVLFLRTADPLAPPQWVGNLLLDRLVAAEIRFVTPEQYGQRDRIMAEAAAELRRAGERPYLIPEGGSNGRGALGYVEAMREVRSQLDSGLAGGPRPFDAVVHACGSGGTAAGCVLGAARYGVAPTVWSIAVCESRSVFETVIGRIVSEAAPLLEGDPHLSDLRVVDDYRGPAYGVASDAQRDFIATVARRSGLILDPVYSGKALYGLAELASKPRRVLFLHTGGLPGLLAQAETFAP
ncbi:MAG: D-cysteine desulfhydrase family protein [Polyangiaceae bacterium]|nr:D-cysteine desulfhydrase family protein [Polyangiaceae bacterium]